MRAPLLAMPFNTRSIRSRHAGLNPHSGANESPEVAGVSAQRRAHRTAFLVSPNASGA
jgi:hypothetical protein